ncbi:MAG: insulinase family protein, partial [candidate division Zixibacteria bacterium]|nr:insulinase family protein [candidate division Zixibacteria bacterium]
PSANDVKKFFAKQNYPQHDMASGEDFKLPKTKATTEMEKRYSEYHREVLPNGITVIVKSNPDSRVFALNIIGKNRSTTELDGKDGITDFVNRLIAKGTANNNASELAMKLSSIGAKVTLYDNPWIPFDDRYTTRQFSFMKFETIDEFTSEGIKLFTEMIERPAFDSVEMEQVRKEIFGLIGRNSGSTYKTASNAFYASLFEGTPYSKKINGTYRTVGSVTLSDLREHHRRIYAPENMIITVGTRQHQAGIMALLREELKKIPTTGFTPTEPNQPNSIIETKSIHEKMDKEQIFIYLGNLLPSTSSPDASALKVASAVLSERLGKNIREKQGLAYQVGSSITLGKKFGWFVCKMGTSSENYIKAKKAILSEIDRLKSEPPTKDELEAAINSIWGSYLSSNLSRINQLYYMGVYEYLGLGYDYGDKYVAGIRSVTIEQVSEAAQKYFDTENYVIATAGNI